MLQRLTDASAESREQQEREAARRAWLQDLDKQRRQQRALKSQQQLLADDPHNPAMLLNPPAWLNSKNPKTAAYNARLRAAKASEDTSSQLTDTVSTHAKPVAPAPAADFFWSHRDRGGGGGEPMRDAQGRTITARRRPDSVASMASADVGRPEGSGTGGTQPSYVRRCSFTNPQGDEADVKRRAAAAQEWQETLKRQMEEKKERERKEKEFMRGSDNPEDAGIKKYQVNGSVPVTTTSLSQDYGITGMSRRRRFVDSNAETGGGWADESPSLAAGVGKPVLGRHGSDEDTKDTKSKRSLLPRARPSPVSLIKLNSGQNGGILEAVSSKARMLEDHRIFFDPAHEQSNRAIPAMNDHTAFEVTRNHDQSDRVAEHIGFAGERQRERSPSQRVECIQQQIEQQSPTRKINRILERVRRTQSRESEVAAATSSLTSLVKSQHKNNHNDRGKIGFGGEKSSQAPPSLLGRVVNSKNRNDLKNRNSFGRTAFGRSVKAEPVIANTRTVATRGRVSEQSLKSVASDRDIVPRPPPLKKVTDSKDDQPVSPRRISNVRPSAIQNQEPAPPAPKFATQQASGSANGSVQAADARGSNVKFRPPWGVEGDTAESPKIPSVRIHRKSNAPWEEQPGSETISGPTRKREGSDGSRPPWGTDADVPNNAASRRKPLAIESGMKSGVRPRLVDDDDSVMRQRVVDELFNFKGMLDDEQRQVFDR